MLIAALLLAASLHAGDSRFRLHNVLQPTGWETCELRRERDEWVLQSTFADTDRGTKNDLATTIRLRNDLRPIAFDSAGRPEAASTVDLHIVVDGEKTLTTKNGQQTVAPTPARFFTIARFAPVVTRELLIRYWKRAPDRELVRIPDNVPMRIHRRGIDRVRVAGKNTRLTRYSIEGIIWGAETVWVDSSDRLIAVITQGGNQFEAVREGFEELLPFFVARAAADRMDFFAGLAKDLGTKHPSTLAITGARIFDGTTHPPIEDGVVIVSGDRIASVGTRATVKIPSGTKVIDATGMTLLPGLWDMHAHFNQVEWGPSYLAAGVTTVRDCGNEFEFITAVHDAIESGHGLGPRILRAGFVDGDGPDAMGTIRVRDENEVHSRIARYVAAGFDQIKIYNSVPPALVPAIVREAHGAGKTVSGHIPRGMTLDEALDAGFDHVSHIRFVQRALVPDGTQSPLDLESDRARALFAKLKQRGTVIDPTLANYEMQYRDVSQPLESIEPAIVEAPPVLAAPLRSTGKPHDEAGNLVPRFRDFLRLVRALHEHGIPIIAGTDMYLPGHTLHRELELYVQAGLTPADALRSATSVPARAMGLESESGTIAPGKRADLILVRGNPLENISDIRNVEVVIARGAVYSPPRLWRAVDFSPRQKPGRPKSGVRRK